MMAANVWRPPRSHNTQNATHFRCDPVSTARQLKGIAMQFHLKHAGGDLPQEIVRFQFVCRWFECDSTRCSVAFSVEWLFISINGILKMHNAGGNRWIAFTAHAGVSFQSIFKCSPVDGLTFVRNGHVIDDGDVFSIEWQLFFFRCYLKSDNIKIYHIKDNWLAKKTIIWVWIWFENVQREKNHDELNIKWAINWVWYRTLFTCNNNVCLQSNWLNIAARDSCMCSNCTRISIVRFSERWNRTLSDSYWRV